MPSTVLQQPPKLMKLTETATEQDLSDAGLVVQAFAWRLARSPETHLFHFFKTLGKRHWRSREGFHSRTTARAAQLNRTLTWECVTWDKREKEGAR